MAASIVPVVWAMAGGPAQTEAKDEAMSPSVRVKAAGHRLTRSTTWRFVDLPATKAEVVRNGSGGGAREVPQNDDCANCSGISDGVTPFSTIGATTDGAAFEGHPDCDRHLDDQINQDIWFDYMPTFTGFLTVSTCGTADFDTKLAIYDGSDCPEDNEHLLACNDEWPGCPNYTAKLIAPVAQGQSYKIRIGGFFTATGTGTMAIEPRCEVACPGGATPEPEPCGEDTNGGCNMAVPAFTPIACGETVCGTAWVEQGGRTINRDTDWYELVLSEETLVTWTVESEFASLVGFVKTVPLGSGDCANMTGFIDPFADGGDCQPVSASQCVPAGTYWLFVRVAAGLLDLPCGSPLGNDYVATVTCQECEGPAPPENDDCENALPIFDGETLFDTDLATTDGPPHDECDFASNDQIYNDIWYDYVASCTGDLTVSLCDSQFDTKLAVYEGIDCPTPDSHPIGCDDDWCSPKSQLTVPVTVNALYKIRIGSFGAGTTGLGAVAITCVATGPNCPGGDVQWLDPPDGVIDAGVPFDVDGGPLQGIDPIHVAAPPGADPECFTLCENDIDVFENSILSVTVIDEGEYMLDLARPITPYSVTTVTYSGTGAIGFFTSHPANANGDDEANPTDVSKVIEYVSGSDTPPWGAYSVDINRSGAPDPADILAVIDLLNGAGAFAPWSGTNLPENTICPE